MSEFEYAILFVEFLNASNVVFANYMTLVFAGLTASWFLARRMTRAVAVSFLLLFTLGAFAIGTGVFFSFSDFFALQAHLAASGESFPALDWLGPLRAGGAVSLVGVQLLILAILVFSWAGTLVFFWIVRGSKSNQPEAAS